MLHYSSAGIQQEYRFGVKPPGSGSYPVEKTRIRPFRKNPQSTLKKKPGCDIFFSKPYQYPTKHQDPDLQGFYNKDPDFNLDKDSFPDPAESLIGKIIQN